MDTKTLDQVSAEYEKVNSNLSEISEQLAEHREKLEARLDQYGDLSKAQKEDVDKLLTQQSEHANRVSALEQTLAAGFDKLGGPSGPRTLGESLVADDDRMAEISELAKSKGRASFEIERPAMALDGNTAAAGGADVDEFRVGGITPLGSRRLTIRDVLPVASTGEGVNAVDFVQESGFTNNAAPVSETTAKPESNITLARQQAPVVTVAHWIHASKQILSDARNLAGHVDMRLRYGLALQEETQLLLGSGAGININGLVTQATAYTPGAVPVTNDQIIDRLRLGLLQVETAEYMPDTIILNNQDWAQMELTKDGNSNYIFGAAQSQPTPTLWGFPVVATNTMTQGTWLVGAFTMGAQLWDRENVTVEIATQDQDDFIKNMVKILCEERIALTVYRPESFVTGDLTITSVA